VLNAVILGECLADCTAHSAFLLHRFDMATGTRYLLFKAAEMKVAACFECVSDAVAILVQCNQPLVLIESATVTRELLSELDRNGVAFFVDVPPGRTERWRQLAGRRAERWWTNDLTGLHGALVQTSRQLTPASEIAAELHGELFVNRVAIPRASSQTLEDSLAVAAAFSTGTIAWRLWRERESPHPLLALERFATLGARVRFSDEEVRVLLPLGRRSADLAAARLLEDVRGLPWLGGRTVTFARG
jgi:hypothetical protein